jgi:hypothetical protein
MPSVVSSEDKDGAEDDEEKDEDEGKDEEVFGGEEFDCIFIIGLINVCIWNIEE